MGWQGGLRTAVVASHKPLSEEVDGCFLLIDLQGEALVGAERQHNDGTAAKPTLLPLGTALPASANPLRRICSRRPLAGCYGGEAATETRTQHSGGGGPPSSTVAPEVTGGDRESMLCFDVWGLIEWQRLQQASQQPFKVGAINTTCAAANNTVVADSTAASAAGPSSRVKGNEQGTAAGGNRSELSGAIQSVHTGMYQLHTERNTLSRQLISELLANSSKSNKSKQPVLHVGSLVLEGHVEEATAIGGGAGIAILRKVRRRVSHPSQRFCDAVKTRAAVDASSSSDVSGTSVPATVTKASHNIDNHISMHIDAATPPPSPPPAAATVRAAGDSAEGCGARIRATSAAGDTAVAHAALEKTSKRSAVDKREEQSAEVCCWEVQAVIRYKITFTARPALHPKKKLFADSGAPSSPSSSSLSETVGAAQPPQQQHQQRWPPQQQQQNLQQQQHRGGGERGIIKDRNVNEKVISSHEGTEMGGSRFAASESAETDCWLLGISPLLLSRACNAGAATGTAGAAEDGGWLLLVVDEYLLDALENGETLQLVGVPRWSPSTISQQQRQQSDRQMQQQQQHELAEHEKQHHLEDQQQQHSCMETTEAEAISAPPAWKGTLLCCKERAYLVQRNAVDGQLLIAFAPPVARAASATKSPQPTSMTSGVLMKRQDGADTSSTASPLCVTEGEVITNDEERKRKKQEGEEANEQSQENLQQQHQQNHRMESTASMPPWESSKEHSASQQVLGVSLVGVCSSVILLEATVGRTRQIEQLLGNGVCSSSDVMYTYCSNSGNRTSSRTDNPSTNCGDLGGVGDADAAAAAKQEEEKKKSEGKERNTPPFVSSAVDGAVKNRRAGLYRFPRPILPSSVLLQAVQASQTETATHLLGGSPLSLLAANSFFASSFSSSALFPSLSSLLSAAEPTISATALSAGDISNAAASGGGATASATTGARAAGAADGSQQHVQHTEQQEEEFSTCASRVRMWGQPLAAATDFTRSTFLLFIPMQQGGYVLLSAAELVGFLQRLIKFLVFLPTKVSKRLNCCSSSSTDSAQRNTHASSRVFRTCNSTSDNERYLTVGDILDTLRDTESKGYSLYPFTTKCETLVFPCASDSKYHMKESSNTNTHKRDSSNKSYIGRNTNNNGGGISSTFHHVSRAEQQEQQQQQTPQGCGPRNSGEEESRMHEAASTAAPAAQSKEHTEALNEAGAKGIPQYVANTLEIDEKEENDPKAVERDGDGSTAGETDKNHQQQHSGRSNLLFLNEGVLIQLLTKICDIKSDTPLPFPSYFVDMCPPLLPLVRSRDNTNGSPAKRAEEAGGAVAERRPCGADQPTSGRVTDASARGSSASSPFYGNGFEEANRVTACGGSSAAAVVGTSDIHGKQKQPVCGDAASNKKKNEDDLVESLHAYEHFLRDDRRVRQCEVYFNWLKLHAWLAASVFRQEGRRTSFPSGIDSMRSTPFYALDVFSFVVHLEKELQHLPLYVVQAADIYLLQCIEHYRDFLHQHVRKQLLLSQEKSIDSSTPIENSVNPTVVRLATASSTARNGKSFVQRSSMSAVVEARVDELLVRAATRVPVVGYGLVKTTLRKHLSGAAAAEWDLLLLRQLPQHTRSCKQVLPTLTKHQMLRACLNGFPELRIPRTAADIWSLEVGATLTDKSLLLRSTSSTRSSSTRSSSTRSSSIITTTIHQGHISPGSQRTTTTTSRSFCGPDDSDEEMEEKRERCVEGPLSRSAGVATTEADVAASRPAATIGEMRQLHKGFLRGQELWKQLLKQPQRTNGCHSSRSYVGRTHGGGTSMAVFLSVLKGRCFFAEGLLLLLPEEELPTTTRDRLATLFMCKSPWWIEEVEALLLPSLTGKEMIGTIAGPPKRFCTTRQVVLNASTHKTQQGEASKTEAAEKQLGSGRVGSQKSQKKNVKNVSSFLDASDQEPRGFASTQGGEKKKDRREKMLHAPLEEDICMVVVSDGSEEQSGGDEQGKEKDDEEEISEDDVDVAIYSHNLPLRYWPVDLSTT